MSVNPCKNADREKDQNNNFVNATAHGGAGIDREGRARRAAARSHAGEEQQHRSGPVGSRGAHYYHSQQQQQQQQQQHLPGQQMPRRDGSVGGGAMAGGATGPGGPQVTAKVMWGNVSAIKELRDKEQSERQLGTRAAGRRQ